MITKNPKISASQLFCMMLVSRLSSEIVYPRTAAGTALEAVLALIISEVIRFLLALPLIVYSFGGNNVHRSVYNRNKVLGWLGAVFAALFLIAAALRTMLNISQFAVKSLLPGGVIWIVFALAAIFAVYSATMGTEALARSGAIFLIAAAVITVTVAVADIPFVNARSFDSLRSFGDGSALLGDIIERVMRGGDYLIFAAMLPYVSIKRTSELGRTGILFAFVSTVAAVAICLVNCIVLREIYGLTEYPFLAAASLSDISLFKRLDGFAAAIWGLCAAFRCGVMLLSAENALAEVYRAGHPAKKEAAQ